MYSSARLDDSRSGLSATTRSDPAMFACFARSSSVAREAELLDALDFGHERVEPSRHAVVGDQRLHDA